LNQLSRLHCSFRFWSGEREPAREWVIGVEDELVEPSDMRAPSHPRDNGLEATDSGLFEDLAGETRTNDALADERLAYRKLPPGMEQGHSSAGASAAGGAVNGPVAKAGHIARQQAAISLLLDRPVKLYPVNGSDMGVPGVRDTELGVRGTPQIYTELGQALRVPRHKLKVEVSSFDEDKKAATIDHIDGQGAMIRKRDAGTPLIEKDRRVLEGDSQHTSIEDLAPGGNQTDRRVKHNG
jgi:hypothetical protein